MDTVFLPGNIRQRLLDLMKHNNVSQTELARKISCNDSLLSRFLSKKQTSSEMKISSALQELSTCLQTFFWA